jgi:hypothetical protein
VKSETSGASESGAGLSKVSVEQAMTIRDLGVKKAGHKYEVLP